MLYGVMTIVLSGSLQTSRFPLDRGLHEVQNGLEREKQNSTATTVPLAKPPRNSSSR